MKSSIFQIVVIAVFGLFVALGMIVLYWTNKGGSGDKVSDVTVWGSLPSATMTGLFKNLQLDKLGINVIYEEKPTDSFDERFIEALAGGYGPDAIILPEESIYRHIDKISKIPFQSISERTFKDSYIKEAELFLTSEGIIGIPFSVDPLIMYWNRDIFASKGLANPPRYWDEFLSLSSKLTEKKGASNITKSAVALGEFSNINNAKEIISALSMQAGNYFTYIDPEYGLSNGIDNNALVSVVDFYSQFSNPLKTVFSWSRSLPNSKAVFSRGDLAIYFGFFSEKNDIVSSNSNFDFDYAFLPQVRDSETKITYGNMLGISVLKSAKNSNGAFKLANLMFNREFAKYWSDTFSLPPIRRDLLSEKPTDSFGVVGYDSALIARGWLDPDGKKTKDLFRDMVENVSSGWQTTSGAVSDFSSKLSEIINSK